MYKYWTTFKPKSIPNEDDFKLGTLTKDIIDDNLSNAENDSVDNIQKNQIFQKPKEENAKKLEEYIINGIVYVSFNDLRTDFKSGLPGHKKSDLLNFIMSQYSIWPLTFKLPKMCIFFVENACGNLKNNLIIDARNHEYSEVLNLFLTAAEEMGKRNRVEVDENTCNENTPVISVIPELNNTWTGVVFKCKGQ
jgi:hypothetical protein